MSHSSAAYPSAVPVGVDTTRASIARVYDAALNGKPVGNKFLTVKREHPPLLGIGYVFFDACPHCPAGFCCRLADC